MSMYKERAKELVKRMTLNEKVGQLAQLFYGFKAYDRQGKEIFPKNYVSDMDDFIYDACYIRVENVRGWEEFEELCNDEFGTYFYDGLDSISETGLYFKDDDHDCWTNWDYEYEKLRAIRRKMDY